MLSSRQRIVCSALSLIGTVGLVATADPAVAAPPAAVHVSYGDLDMASAAGRTAFDRRVAAAATAVCRDDGRQPLSIGMACRRDAIDQARDAAGIGRRG